MAKLCTKTISDSLQDAYQKVENEIPRQDQLGSDETNIKDNGKKHWIWCITAPTFTLFHIAKTRSRAVLEKLVGDEFAGYLNFDYFSANCSFAWNYWGKAQYYRDHLIRDIRFLQKHPDERTKAWAAQLLDRSRRLFRAWHRRDEMTDEGFHRSILTHRDRFLELVRNPPGSKEAANLTARFAIVEYTIEESGEVEMYDLSQDYFRFMFADGVEPTNNHSEQQIRHCVIDRRITPGDARRTGPAVPRTNVDRHRHLKKAKPTILPLPLRIHLRQTKKSAHTKTHPTIIRERLPKSPHLGRSAKRNHVQTGCPAENTPPSFRFPVGYVFGHRATSLFRVQIQTEG